MTAGFQVQTFDDDRDYSYLSDDDEDDDSDDHLDDQSSGEARYSDSDVDHDDRDFYRFEVADGAVTAVYEFDDGRWEREYIEFNETYELREDGSIFKTERERYGLDSEIYSDADGDGLYQKSSKVWSPADNAVSLEQDLVGLSNQFLPESSLISRVGYERTTSLLFKMGLFFRFMNWMMAF